MLINRILHSLRWRIIHTWYSYILPFKLKVYAVFIRATMPLRKVHHTKKHSLPGELIVSLTSYEPRFKTLHLTLQTLINQSTQADKIIVWLTEDDSKKLPKKLNAIINNNKIVNVEICENLKSYKKLIPALNKYPDAFIITADDDLYYPKTWIKDLVDKWDNNYKTLVVQRAHQITYAEPNVPNKYMEWILDISKADQYDIFPTTGSGILYPPHCLPEISDNISLINELCSGSDDIWFFWMAHIAGNHYVLVDNPYRVISWIGSQDFALHKTNITAGKNDANIKNMIDYFGWPIK